MFAPMDAHGHVNSCIDVAQVLLAKGHRIMFAVDAAWKGKLAKYGFEEELMSLGDKDDSKEFWPQFIAEQGGQFLDAEPIDLLELFKHWLRKQCLNITPKLNHN